MNNTEVELKLLIDPTDIPKLRRHPLLKTLCSSGPKTRKLSSTYFDTDEFDLKNQGVALRVRRSGQLWIQTIKGGGSVQAGLHQRNEWEAPVAHNAPDFTKITDPGLIRLFASDGLRQRLHPVFVTEFRRTTWLLETTTGDQVEMALDQGEIHGNQKISPICEVELELKSGNPAVLYELALALHDSVHLTPENINKAERGYALCGARYDLQPVKACSPDIRRDMTVEEAFCSIAWNCISQLQGNQQRLRLAYDPEYIHQMRVAVRRLRCVLGMFAVAAPEIKHMALAANLRELSAQLGAARDWDVFLGEVLPPVITAFPDNEGLNWLQQQAEKICREKREQAAMEVLGPHYNEIVLGLGAWLGRTPWRTKKSAVELDRPVSVFASAILEQRYRKVMRCGRHLKVLTAEQRHALRIAAKKLRYAAEFFSGLYPRKMTSLYIQTLSRLQDEFGALNDQVVAGRLLTQIGKNKQLRDRASGVIADWYACKADLQLANMVQRWKRFKNSKIFWGRSE